MDRCLDCGVYYLIVDGKDFFIKVLVNGRKNNSRDLIETNKLSDFLDSLILSISEQKESVQYESRADKIFTTPPPFKSDSIPILGK